MKPNQVFEDLPIFTMLQDLLLPPAHRKLVMNVTDN